MHAVSYIGMLAAIYGTTQYIIMFGLYRKAEVEITNKAEFEKTLTRMIELLQDSGFGAQATVVRHLLTALIEDKKEFLKTIKGVDMWVDQGQFGKLVDLKLTRMSENFMDLL
jgi:hypothetical protein